MPTSTPAMDPTRASARARLSHARGAVAAVAVLIALGMVARGAAQRPAGGQAEPQPLRVISFGGVSTVPLLVAEAHGLFKKHGVTVTIEFTPNSQVLRDGLAAGKYDVAHAAVDNAVAMVETGGADVVILMGSDDSMNELIVQPAIESVAALRGKTVIVDAPSTAYALQLRKILRLSGLTDGVDYTIKVVGGTPQRLQAMLKDRENAASMLNPPFSIQGKNAGLKSLGSAARLIGPYQGVGAFTMRPWARDHRDTLVRYLAAYVDGLRWFLAPANKSEAVAFLNSALKLPPDVADQAYAQAVAAPGGLATDARLNLDGLRNVLGLRAELEHQWNGTPPPPERYYDPAYYRLALERLAGTPR